jgi:predicted  nucleic acid-binding Zn-ribbon protein
MQCQKCERRVEDRAIRKGCPDCGAKEWAWINEPVKPYRLSEHDRQFLHENKILPDA